MPYARVKNELPLIPGYASGNIITIDAAAAPLNKCIVDILPVQSGTGNPSPTNIRPISGWSGVNVTVNDGQIPPVIEKVTYINFGTTVYGGTLDVTTGVLTATHVIEDLGNLSWSYLTLGSIPRFQANLITNAKPLEDNTKIANAISEIFGVNSWSNVTNVDTYDNTLALNSGGNVITVHCSSYTDENVFDTAVTGKYICYELATPTSIQLTPTEVKTLLGQNNIFADSGDMDIIYIRRSGT